MSDPKLKKELDFAFKGDLRDLKLSLLTKYTESIRNALYDVNMPNTDAIITHIDKVFIDFEKKIRGKLEIEKC